MSQVSEGAANALPPAYPHKLKHFSKTFVDPSHSVITVSAVSEVSKLEEEEVTAPVARKHRRNKTLRQAQIATVSH